MFRTALTVVLVLSGGCLFGAQHVITSLPYEASQNYDTLILAGTKLTGSGNGITVRGHDVCINLGNDTLIFGADGGDNHFGILLQGPSHDVQILGGTILHGGAGNNNRCVYFSFTHDVLIQNTSMVVNGTNGHCIDAASVGPPGNYNIEISGGDYWNNSHGYDNRCMYDGCAIRLWNSTYGGYGDYHYSIHDIVLHTTPGQGIMLCGRNQTGNEAKVFVYNNDLTGDARNSFYDYCAPNCSTCHSSANPYLIALIKCAPGSMCYNNELYSGTEYGGSRGILIENSMGSIDHPIIINNNYMDLHEGPNHEYANGFLQALRIRSIDGGSHGNLYIHNNTIIGTADNNPSTTAYGQEVRIFFHSVQSGDGGNVIVESNRFIARAMSPGTDCRAFIVESTPNIDVINNRYRYNYFESDGVIAKLGDTNLPGNDIILENDTLSFSSTQYNPRVTIQVGRYEGASLNNIVRDCIYINGATDTNIVWRHCFDGDNELSLQRTAEISVQGYNGLPVPGTQVTLLSNYGKAAYSGLTGYDGQVRPVVTYWYESEYSSDSTGYNSFIVKAIKDNDSATAPMTINNTTGQISLLLANTAGEECDDCDYLCGDVNIDANINLRDLIFIIKYIYYGGPAPDPMESANVDGNSYVNLMDIVYLKNYIYVGGAAPQCEPLK